MSLFHIHVKEPSGFIGIHRVESSNPDDAIHKCREMDRYIPEKDHRVVRCVRIDRRTKHPSGGLA